MTCYAVAEDKGRLALAFGSGYRLLWAKEGRKWATLRDASGRRLRMAMTAWAAIPKAPNGDQLRPAEALALLRRQRP